MASEPRDRPTRQGIWNARTLGAVARDGNRSFESSGSPATSRKPADERSGGIGIFTAAPGGRPDWRLRFVATLLLPRR